MRECYALKERVVNKKILDRFKYYMFMLVTINLITIHLIIVNFYYSIIEII